MVVLEENACVGIVLLTGMVRYVVTAAKFIVLVIVFVVTYRWGKGQKQRAAIPSTIPPSSSAPVPSCPPSIAEEIEVECEKFVSTSSEGNESFRYGLTGGAVGSPDYCPYTNLHVPNLHKHEIYTTEVIYLYP